MVHFCLFYLHIYFLDKSKTFFLKILHLILLQSFCRCKQCILSMFTHSSSLLLLCTLNVPSSLLHVRSLLITHRILLVLPTEMVDDLVDLTLCRYQELLGVGVEQPHHVQKTAFHSSPPHPQLFFFPPPLPGCSLSPGRGDIDAAVSLRAEHSTATYSRGR